jgi:enamine deaminase RidA (YjgF/YER057c/UK114 family)
MTIIRHETGPRMSEASIFNGVVHLAGQIAEGATVREQTQGALNEIDRLLALCNSSKERILSAQVWLADIADFAEMNAAWDAWVAPGHAPSRATCEAKLAAPQYRVEIIVTGAQNV